MAVYKIRGIECSDQTDWFPDTSTCGTTNVIVLYIFDVNYICSIPIKN